MKRNIFLGVVLGLVCLMITVAFATSFTYTYDTATPVGTDAPSTLDDSDRNIKAALQERLNVEHVFDKTGTEVSHANTGQHTGINCTSITNTGNAAHTGTLGSTGNFAVNTNKFTVTAATGNTAIAGTLGVTGVATVAKGSLLASSDAPTTDAMIANKKYVDDQITANAVDSDSLCKGWAYVAANGTLLAGFNATSAKTATGKYTITWGTNFSSANYAVTGTTHDASPRDVLNVITQTAGAITVETGEQGSGLADTIFSVTAFGEQ